AATEAGAALRAFKALGAEPEATRARQLVDAASGGGDTHLTRRERDVLHLLAEGLTNRQIAQRLVVSEHTVHRHVTNILRRLELPSRTAAAAYAVRTDLVTRQ
ncbi:MAG: response regulator transcription factor, partial [Aldersonia sp.]|nr:response regulator transcription factor [Aldersonia sp.]